MKKEKSNIPLYIVVFSVNLLSFCTGSSYSWTSPVLPKLSSHDPEINPLGTPITASQEGWIASVINLGASVGCILSAPISEKCGRKKTLLIFSIAFLSALLLFAFGKSVHSYILARFIIGLGSGCVFSVVPSFVGELAEDKNRGLLTCIMGIMVSLGYLWGYGFGPFVSINLFNHINFIPLLLFYPTFVLLVPESPYHFVAIDDNSAAEKSLKKVRSYSHGMLEKELLYIKEYSLEKSKNSTSIRDFLKSEVLRTGLTVTCTLVFFQQLSGTTIINIHMESIFNASKSSIPSHISVIVVGSIQFLTNILTSALVDRLGRKPMLILSNLGTSLSLLSLGTYFYLQSHSHDVTDIYYVPIASLICFMVFYHLGMGPIPFTIIGEVFSSNVKSIAASISTFCCVMFAFLITAIYPYLTSIFGMAGTFWFFSACCAIALLFTVLFVPETKGKNFKQIESLLTKQ